jgi:hypothetical protein
MKRGARGQNRRLGDEWKAVCERLECVTSGSRVARKRGACDSVAGDELVVEFRRIARNSGVNAAGIVPNAGSRKPLIAASVEKRRSGAPSSACVCSNSFAM